MFRIHTKEKISKEIFTVNLTQEEVNLVLEGNIFKDHPELNPQDYIVIEQDYPFDYPTFKDNTIKEMTIYERYQNGLYALSEREKEYQGDIITLSEGQYIDESGVLQTVPKPEGTRVEWNWETHDWEEKATNLEIVQAQYNEYEGMDTPSTLEEMKQQDPALATEYLNMMIELRSLIYTLSTDVQPLAEDRTVGFAVLPIPQPSKALKEFKNKFKLTK